MKGKKQEVKKGQAVGKQGLLAKDIIPASIKQPQREGKSVKLPTQEEKVEKKVEFQPFQMPEVWPGDEEAKNFNFGLDSNQVYQDPFQLNLPPSFELASSQITFWRRPKEFMVEDLEEKRVNLLQMMQLNTKVDTLQSRDLTIKTKKAVKKSPQQSSAQKKAGKDESTEVQRRKRINTYVDKQKFTDDLEVGSLSPTSRKKLALLEEEKVELNLKIFQTKERPELPEEAEERKKQAELAAQAAAKDKKKGGKPAKDEKQDDQEQGEVMVKECKLTNIDISGNYPSYSKWVASQLQIIKDRNIKDVNTGKAIWTKIYPQVDGIPVYNKSGKYWIKMYFMGKERKIEIDDRMPTNVKKNCLFPRSVSYDEIWPMLFTKALLKLWHYNNNFAAMTEDIETGDFQVMYALTGLIPEQIVLDNLQADTLKYLNDLSRDIHYNRNSNFITCYCNADYKPHAPSNVIQTKKDAFLEIVSLNRNVKKFEKFEEAEDSDQEIENKFEEQFNKSPGRQRSPSLQAKVQVRVPGVEGEYENQQRDILDFLGLSAQQQQNLKKGGAFTQGDPSNLQSVDLGEQKEQIRSTKKNLTVASGQPQDQQHKISQITEMKERPTYVIPGFAYSVVEAFFNEQFNMVYTKERTDMEIKLRQEYYQMMNVNMHKLSKEDKLEFRRKKKELREKTHEEEKKRVELITKAPIQYRFFRVKSAVAKVPLLNFISPFSAKEIYIAKKCILNRLTKPPNYDLPELKGGDDKSVVSQSVAKTNLQDLESFMPQPLDEFAPNAREPMKRSAGGGWILDKDIATAFQYICIYHNYNLMPFQKTIFCEPNLDSDFTKNEDIEVLVIQKNEGEEEQKQIELQLFSNNSSAMLIGFQPMQSKNKEMFYKPSCILQKFDFELMKPVENLKIINGKMDGFHHFFKNDHQVYRIQIGNPLGYSLFFSSTNKFSLMSISDYLKQTYQYEHKEFQIEYQALEKNKYHLYVKYLISNIQSQTNFIVKIRSTSATDKYFLKYLRFKLIYLPPHQEYLQNKLEGVQMNMNESIMADVAAYNRFTLQENEKYILLVEGLHPYQLAEGTFDIDILFRNGENSLNIENIEMVEPLEYYDRYMPAKYGIIFRERLFLGVDNCYTTIFLKLVDVPRPDSSGSNQPLDPKQKAAADKAKKQAKQEEEVLVEKELEVKRYIKFELFEENQLLAQCYGHNYALFSNIILNSNKIPDQPDKFKNYYLQATFDLRDWPDCKVMNQETSGLLWQLKVYSSDTLVIIKDTQKVDHENALKKTWEDNELGRADKAKRSRQKQQLLEKQKNGQQLSEQELEIVNEQRERKKKYKKDDGNLDDPKKKGGAAGKAAQKQPPPKGLAKAPIGKDQKQPGVQQEEDEQLLLEKEREKNLPKAVSHNMNEIQNFLAHMEKDRLLEFYPSHGGLVDVRSEENKKELIEQSKFVKEEFLAKFIQNNLQRQQLQKLEQNQFTSLQTQLQDHRKQYKENIEKLMNLRSEFKKKFSSKKDQEKQLLDICNQDKPDKSALEQLIIKAEEQADFDRKIIQIARKILVNVRIYEIIDKLQTGIEGFELEQIQAAIKEIERWSIEVDQEIIAKAQEIIDEADADPEYITQKQAELKKQKKGGKK